VNRTAKFLRKLGTPRNPVGIPNFCDDWNMTFEEQLASIAQNLDTLTKIHLDNDREYRERFTALGKAQENLTKALADFNADVTRYAASMDRVIEQLSNLALDHERRLKDLEDK
jgi:hypothetical protein